MNGLSIPNTPIVVDYWNLKDVHSRSLFFLSHMHAGIRISALYVLHTFHIQFLHTHLIIHQYHICSLSNPEMHYKAIALGIKFECIHFTDHTSGLSELWNHPIYCTPVTGKLLRHKFNIKQDLIVELTLGEPKIVTVNCPGDRVSITVTALDANHCPGSAMFLFEGYFGTIFYTGDFRYVDN